MSETYLERCFVPKTDVEITPECLFKLKRGIGYKKIAWACLFELGIDFLKSRR